MSCSPSVEVGFPSPTHASMEAEQRRFGSQGEVSRFATFVRGDWGSLLLQRPQLPSNSVTDALDWTPSSNELGGPNHWRSRRELSCAIWTEFLVCLPARRRLVALWEDFPDEVQSHQPVVPFQLDHEAVLHNLRIARRGAALGPSGMV